jgi:hypothetical protein
MRMRPGLSGVARLVDAVARRQIAAQARLAHADVDDVRVRLGDRHGADRSALDEGVRNVAPRHAGIVGLPHTAAGGAHVVHQRLAGDAGHGGDAAAAVRPDAAPTQRIGEPGARLSDDRMHERRDGDRKGGKA